MRNEKGDRSSKTRYRFNRDRLALLLSLGWWLSITSSVQGQAPQLSPISTPSTAPSSAPSSPTPSASPPARPSSKPPIKCPNPEPRVLVNEVVIKGAEKPLQAEAYEVIKTKPKQTSTCSQIQQDVNAIFGTGYFSNVKADPEDTPTGVRVTFAVTPNPVLRSVQIEGKRVLPDEVVSRIFDAQYGKVLNLNTLQKGIKQVKKWYLDGGYALAQVLDSPAVSPDGVVTLRVAEGEVAAIEVRFINKDGSTIDPKTRQPIRGRTSDLVITREFKTKPGDIFNRQVVEGDIYRTSCLGIFEDVRLALEPSKADPREVLIVVNTVEKESLTINPKDDELAERLFDSGACLEAKQTFEFRREAIQKYHEALQIYRNINEKAKAAIVLNRLGNAYSDLSDYQRALNSYNEARSLSQALDFTELEAVTLNNIGNLYFQIEEYKKAFSAYQEVLPKWQNAKNTTTRNQRISGLVSLIYVLNAAGSGTKFFLTPTKLGELENNVSFANEGFAEASTLVRIGELYQRFGDYQQALYAFEQALHQWQSSKPQRPLKDKAYAQFFEGVMLRLISNLYADMEQQELAIAYAKQVQPTIEPLLESLKKSKNNQNLASLISLLLINSPNLDQQLGESYDKMLELFASFGGQWQQVVISALADRGEFFARLDQIQRAEKYYQEVLELSQTVADPQNTSDVWQQPGFLDAVGRAYRGMGQWEQALEMFNRILKLPETANNYFMQARTHLAIGETYFQSKQYPLAFNAYGQALQTATPNSWQLAEAQFGMARIQRIYGNWSNAQQLGQKTLERLEDQPFRPDKNLNWNFRVNQNQRSDVGSSQSKNPQSQRLDSQLQQPSKPQPSEFQFYREATGFFARNRKFYEFYVDLLSQRYLQTGDAQYKKLALQTSEQFQAASLRTLLGRPNPEADPRYASPLQPLQTTEIQKLLDDETVLVEYFLGEERSHLWLVTNKTITYHALPKRADLATVAQTYYSYLTVPSLRVRTQKTNQAGQALSNLLLGKIAKDLGNKRVLIVADGFLQYIPFSALPVPQAGARTAIQTSTNEPKLLLEQHQEIISLPAASSIAFLRQHHRAKPTPTKTLAILADPVFNPPSQVAALGDRLNSNTKEIVPSSTAPKLEPLYPALPGTRKQAIEIVTSLKLPESERLMKFGLDANHQAALNPELGQYRILHFATHGILDDERPERSGMILSGVNRQNEPRRGLLSPADVLGLNLSADLVVLSGCRTGLGATTTRGSRLNTKEPIPARAEGLVGLTGSFMVAGADRVVASLWSVDEAATTELMKLFYRNVFEKKMRYAEALTAAQRTLRSNPRWREPYYWAGFIIQGEWK